MNSLLFTITFMNCRCIKPFSTGGIKHCSVFLSVGLSVAYVGLPAFLRLIQVLYPLRPNSLLLHFAVQAKPIPFLITDVGAL